MGIIDEAGKLNKFGIPINSPLAKGSSVIPGYSFNQMNERNAVTNYNIKNFSFNKATGGTISVVANLGSGTNGSILLDGANNRIIVNDGTNDRVLIGFGTF